MFLTAFSFQERKKEKKIIIIEIVPQMLESADKTDWMVGWLME